ncbi:hypothetical protein [Deinococcus sp.]|uniref:DUF6881 domain-containing protein n=1 Tax=Deinococcus sp. TaxID=47478 RepID=UPI0025BD4C30|nr:hypothetical protein [Deinococcus sp.]
MRNRRAFELVQWLNSAFDEPCILATQLNEERWKVRKLEIFPDGAVYRFILEEELAKLPWPLQKDTPSDEKIFGPFVGRLNYLKTLRHHPVFNSVTQEQVRASKPLDP